MTRSGVTLLTTAVALLLFSARASGEGLSPPPPPVSPAQPSVPPQENQASAPKATQEKMSPEGTKEELERAQQHFLEGLRALGSAGRRTIEENVPEMQDKARKTIEETKKLIQQWEENLRKLEQDFSTPPKAPPPAPAQKNTSAI
ncbi:MAG: hypothetical protein HQL64_10365 [Magnetococcales bacterium]|nr:hypothetical protein [Magnetococcales bacterium]